MMTATQNNINLSEYNCDNGTSEATSGAIQAYPMGQAYSMLLIKNLSRKQVDIQQYNTNID